MLIALVYAVATCNHNIEANFLTQSSIPSLGAMEHDPKFSVKVFFFAAYSSMGCP